MPSNTRAYLFRVAPKQVNKIDDALRRNRIYIGWNAPALLDPAATKRDFKTSVASTHPDYNANQLGIAASHLWRFIREMKAGDFVLVPSKAQQRRIFYIARIVGPSRYYRGSDSDIALERSVEWLNDKQPVNHVSPALNALMDYRQTSLPASDAILRELQAQVGGQWYPDELDESRSYPEGAKQQVLVNKYERDPKARAACIKIHGLRCKVCGFDFQAQYGEAGKGLIHVHHLKPVSRLGTRYRVNPRTDLCPICPNCHAIVHPSQRRTLTIKAAKRLVLHSFPW